MKFRWVSLSNVARLLGDEEGGEGGDDVWVLLLGGGHFRRVEGDDVLLDFVQVKGFI